ncbi:MAG: hypothetical protein ACD_39C00517G0002 [uncultured bacterium]|nr:MAG: hypothetical protein ACD_39C00517G0002 [uncultured bacterium]
MVKSMIKKILLFIAVLFAVVAPVVAADDADCKLINSLNYHKGMFDAVKSEVFLKIPLGSGSAAVGGDEQDTERYTSGVPFAFRPAENGGVWVLDSVNKALKLFGKDGAVLQNISIAQFGPVVRDFAFDGKNGFWLLSAVDGFIYRIDMTGKLVSQIEGFSGARAIETGVLEELLVDMPTMSSVLRFSNDELLKEQYPGDESLSMIEGVGGKLLVFDISEKLARLQLRNIASPAENIPLAEFPLDIEDPAVKYVSAQVIGHDNDGNLYLSLTACHETSGAIYRDRIYRCTAAGKILAQKDIIMFPCLSADLPRERVVTADGKVMTYYVDGNDYVLAVYSL